MSIFSKDSKKKIAIALACASVLSGNVSSAIRNTDRVVLPKYMEKLVKESK